MPVSLQIEFRKLLERQNCTPFALISEQDTTNLKTKVSQLIKRQIESDSIKYLCIIGDWNDVPPIRVDNLFIDDSDQYCFSDALYACYEQYDPEDVSSAIPSILVGRIPSKNINTLSSVLFVSPPPIDLKKTFLFSVSAECWQEATQTIISEFFSNVKPGNLIHDPDCIDQIPKGALLTSPLWSEVDLKQQTEGHITESFGIIHFNVHGGPDSPEWVGESFENEYEEIFSPNTITDFNSALLVSEACYGGALGYDSPSVVESFFENGGHAFVGSSTIAYGSPYSDINAADLIALHFIKSIINGSSLGEALNIAKYELLVDDPLTQDITNKTILSFNLFGAPWHQRVSANAPLNRDLNQSSGKSVLDRVRSRQNSSLNTNNTSFISGIRENYRSRLPVKIKKAVLEREVAWEVFKKLKDYDRINQAIINFGAHPNDIHVESLISGDNKGYAVYVPSKLDNKYKKTMIFITNVDGNIRKTFISKRKK